MIWVKCTQAFLCQQGYLEFGKSLFHVYCIKAEMLDSFRTQNNEHQLYLLGLQGPFSKLNLVQEEHIIFHWM